MLTIHAIFEPNVLVNEQPREPEVGGFERYEPNDMWPYMAGENVLCLPAASHSVSILEDQSPFGAWPYVIRELSGERPCPCSVKSFRRYGVRRAVQMDRGSTRQSAWNAQGLMVIQMADRAMDSAAVWARGSSAGGRVKRRTMCSSHER